MGGPWFTQIDHQTYIQFSPAFGLAVRELINSLGLPLGEPNAMSCMGSTVFEKAFP
jgi:hypothetical protein